MSLERRRVQRLYSPAKRLGAVALIIDAGASCALLGAQFRANLNFHASTLEVGLLGTISAVTGVLCPYASGTLSDRWGRRGAEIVAMSCCLGAWLGMSFATSLTQLYLLSALGGIGLGFVWAPLAAWVSDLSGGSQRLLNRYLGFYNFGWSAGLMVGPLAAGALWEISPHLVFGSSVATALVCLILVCVTPQPPGHHAPASETQTLSRDLVWLFLLMAWGGGFAASYGRGVINALFPKVGLEAAFSPLTIGQISFAAPAGETLVFVLLRFTTRWQFRPSWQVVNVLVSAGAMMMAWRTANPWVFAGCFAVLGGGLGLSYAAAIQAAMQVGAQRGRLAGFNEMIFGGGLFLGPLLGGIFGQMLGLRAAFSVTAVVCLLVVGVQGLLWVRWQRNQRQAN